MIRALVVDDEPYARKGVRMLLELHSDIEIVGEAGTGREAVRQILDLDPDVVLLDVQMPDLDGFEVLESLPEGVFPAIIFITAYDEYAVRAFEANAVDYLLKPLDKERFDDSLTRVKSLLGSRRLLTEDPVPLLEAHRAELAGERSIYLERLTVPTRHGHKILHAEQIDWIEAQDYYARLHVGENSHLAKVSMARLASDLDPRSFVRIHRSTIVNLEAVDLVETPASDEIWVLLKSGIRRRVSRSGLKALRGALEMLR